MDRGGKLVWFPDVAAAFVSKKIAHTRGALARYACKAPWAPKAEETADVADGGTEPLISFRVAWRSPSLTPVWFNFKKIYFHYHYFYFFLKYDVFGTHILHFFSNSTRLDTLLTNRHSFFVYKSVGTVLNKEKKFSRECCGLGVEIKNI
jgi:hypothetical protein